MQTYDLDKVLHVLNKHHQRATYGAVAKLIGKPPQSLMHGRRRDAFHSWVVSKENGLPSQYSDQAKHPKLLEQPTVISDSEQLAQWLSTRIS